MTPFWCFPIDSRPTSCPTRCTLLNVSFLVPEMRREFGGCAANIAYGLKLLGDRGMAMATAGHDFAPYRERMLAQGAPVDHIKIMDEDLYRAGLHHHRSWMTIRSRPFIPAQCSTRT